MELFELIDIVRLNPEQAQAKIRGLCRHFQPKSGEMVCRVLGRYLMHIDPSDVSLAPWLIVDGFWEFWVTQFVTSSVKPGMVAIDVGANFGYFTLLMAGLAGSRGSCTAFEANPKVASYLRRTVFQNGLNGHCNIHTVALADGHKPSVQFFIPGRELGGGHIGSGSSDIEGELIDTPVPTLDAVCADWPRLDFVKIDAEGSEPAIIEGALETIRRLNPAILLEFTSGAGHSKPFLKRLMQLFPGHPTYVAQSGKLGKATEHQLLDAPAGTTWMLYFKR